MGTTLRDKLKTLSVERQEKIARRATELIEEEMSLRGLRETCELTQEHMAKLLDIPQGSVSRMEKQRDWRLSTLRSYVRAMGGELDVVVRLPHHAPIRLINSSIEKIETKPPTERKRKRKASQTIESTSHRL